MALSKEEMSDLYKFMEEEKHNEFFFDCDGRSNGKTFLHYAAHINDPSTATLLLQCGADANQRDNYLTTPLEEYIRMGYRDARMYEVLLSHGASPRAFHYFIEYYPYRDDTEYIFEDNDDDSDDDWTQTVKLFLTYGAPIYDERILRDKRFNEDDVAAMHRYRNRKRLEKVTALLLSSSFEE